MKDLTATEIGNVLADDDTVDRLAIIIADNLQLSSGSIIKNIEKAYTLAAHFAHAKQNLIDQGHAEAIASIRASRGG
jgi:hypothetical protein